MKDGKRRIIINISGDMPEERALNYVASVISSGRISDNGKSYCYCTEFLGNVLVIAKATKTSDIFNVYQNQAIYEKGGADNG